MINMSIPQLLPDDPPTSTPAAQQKPAKPPINPNPIQVMADISETDPAQLIKECDQKS